MDRARPRRGACPVICRRTDAGPTPGVTTGRAQCLSRILGPSMAGVLMSSVGAMSCFVVRAVAYVPFIGVALGILPRRTPEPPRAEALTRRHPFAGLGDILGARQLRGALFTVLAGSVLCGPLVVFSPVL